MAAATLASLKIQRPSESNLAVTVLDRELRVILLTAANRNSGITSSSLSMASELARTSRGRVLLVDTSLSDNSLTRRLDLGERPGFLDLALADTPPLLAQCIESSDELGFDFLPLGRRQQYAERLTPELLQELLQALAADYRFVIIDGDPVYSSGDILTLSTQVDGVVLVVRSSTPAWVSDGARNDVAQDERSTRLSVGRQVKPTLGFMLLPKSS